MKNKYIKIGNRRIGEDFDPLVIAEIGINHEGSLKTAYGSDMVGISIPRRLYIIWMIISEVFI